MYNNYISELRNFRMHLESHEEHLIRQIRTPLERDDLQQSLQRIAEHEVARNRPVGRAERRRVRYLTCARCRGRRQS